MQIKDTPIGEIQPYKRNAKRHDAKQVANVAESIRRYGFVQPIVMDRDGVIVIGHCRYAAARKLGMRSVPCVCVDELTPEQVAALRIVDNKTNESPWDWHVLSQELPEIDLSAFDFEVALPFATGPQQTEEPVEEDAVTAEQMDELFADAPPKEIEPKKIQCPHCGEWFVP